MELQSSLLGFISSIPNGKKILGLLYVKDLTKLHIQVTTSPTLLTKGSLTRGWDQTWIQFMKTFMFVLRTREATCLKHEAKLKEPVVCAIASKTAWEQTYPFHVFYRSSRKSRQHVHISTVLTRYLLMLNHYPCFFT